MSHDPRRNIPGIDRLLASPEAAVLLERWPRERVVDALRVAVDQARRASVADDGGHDLAQPVVHVDRARTHLESADRSSLERVVNATGVVLHTNLGRAVLAPEAIAAMRTAATAYGNLEFDLESGQRGSRYSHGVELLCELTGAEDGLVVNNCAAALMLSLAATARGRGVLVSRGELVEIGGGFRIPEILEQAGARLVEVGSTNRTRVADYRKALEERGPIGAILKVHRANFRMSGFTEETSLEELVQLGRSAGVPVVHDVGSGLLIDPSRLHLPPEPTPAGSMQAGAELAVFSGDKLLGGPQAGLVVGRTIMVRRLRRSPLCRALRVDKSTLAALDATLRLYRDPATVLERIPTLAMLRRPLDELHSLAERLAEELRHGLDQELAQAHLEVRPGYGRIGGGTYPEHPLPSWQVTLQLPGLSASDLARGLRAATPPVVGRVEAEQVVFDVRTLLPGDTDAIVRAVRQAAAPAAPAEPGTSVAAPASAAPGTSEAARTSLAADDSDPAAGPDA